ncbi:daunorubicin resistance protein DrrA family ABC transporter ATP-binding protein [Gordonia jinhuaensis]|uniref:Daunorubicin resistance protein DrrA family ABC transporter ATP-binding protein n=2 Tax=Gordonia jinhuaensis TaxID=1517702 RepID=A0A916TK06_9ACTN|nr:daunorubicin resistance protein DrrA family ABC transporter ATP-binding protein [Gordonia jinhuaensis]
MGSGIEVEHLGKDFGGQTAVDDVSFTVAPGTVLALLGPNGAGKTTTVSMLSTLLQPDRGTARICGFDVRDRSHDVRRIISLTGQFAALDEALTGRENLTLFGELNGLSRSAARTRADELLGYFDLTDAARKRVGKYSGGMRRRIDIACGLIVRPQVVFLDEPTTGLDPRSRMGVWNLVRALRSEGVTTVLTTQYLEEADELSDRIVVIDHGTVVAEGTADELKTQVADTYCEIQCARVADVSRAATGLAFTLGLSVTRVGDTDDRIALAARDGAATVAAAAGFLADAGIEVTDIRLARPSLDQVFVALTGGDAHADPQRRGRHAAAGPAAAS